MTSQLSRSLFTQAVIFTLLAAQALAAVPTESCESDASCQETNSFNVCVDNFCVHKEVFPQKGLEIGGIFVLVTLKILCTMAGVGGGGIVTPLCMVFYGFVTKDAVACAAFATFAATLGSFITSFKQKHPEKKTSVLTDYGLTCIMMPTTLAGAQIGSLILIVFPTPVIQIMLVLMLIGLGLQSLRKGFQIRKKENAKIKLALEKKKADEAVASQQLEQQQQDGATVEKDVTVKDNQSEVNKSVTESTKPKLELEVIRFDPEMRLRENQSQRSAMSERGSNKGSASKKDILRDSPTESADDKESIGGVPDLAQESNAPESARGEHSRKSLLPPISKNRVVAMNGAELAQDSAAAPETQEANSLKDQKEAENAQENAIAIQEDESENEVAFAPVADGKKLKHVQAGKYMFIIGEDEKTDKDLKYLVWLIRAETGNLQPGKWAINVSLITYLALMNLALPTKSRPSPIGITRCSAEYWLLQISFIIFCLLMVTFAIWRLKRDQDLKIRYGNINIVESDIIFNRKNLTILLFLGFMGGILAGALGLGGGVIFNPVLLTMGLPPQVSGACSLYMVFFSKIASCLVYILNGQMNIMYALWVGLWASVGGVIGSLALIIYVKFGGRQSTIVFILVMEFVISVSMIPYFGTMQVKADYDKGEDIWAFSSLC